ncbi:hypothetical protein Nmel_005694 [Mimus melanotis]
MLNKNASAGRQTVLHKLYCYHLLVAYIILSFLGYKEQNNLFITCKLVNFFRL